MGPIHIQVAYGQDRETGRWWCPARVAWNLDADQPMTLELQERLCFTATACGSYQKAAEVAATWGCPADDSTIQRQVHKVGERALREEDTRVRAAETPSLRKRLIERAAEDLPARPFSLVIMMDGWMARERGEQWGLKPKETPGQRVVWREMKTARIFRLSDRAESQPGRGVLLESFYVAHQGEPHELGRKIHAEALRRGLQQAREVFVVADGGVWIWNLKSERFFHARGVLDFYHASQHLWAVAHALYGDQSPAARQWVDPLLHQLRHGGESGVLETLEGLPALCADLAGQQQETIQREVNYFRNHEDHLHYQEAASRGCPVGSGAMESVCSQLQNRLKRTGQFWTEEGKNNLLALELAYRNGYWAELWQIPVELW